MVAGGKLCFVFPGQASQKAGMAAELLDQEEAARAVFRTACEVLALDLVALCTSADDATLTRTDVAQPALLTTEVAWLQTLTARGLRPDLVAGHSLGEFSAWVAAGVLEFGEALRLVQRRGALMEAAAAQRPGTMAAIIGLDEAQVEGLCEAARAVGEVVVANYNSPGQVVVSGEMMAVNEVSGRAKEAGGRALSLRVSGAFHSSLMEEAGREFAALVAAAPLSDPAIPVIANTTASPVTRAAEAREAMARQLTSPVRWTASISRLVTEGATRFLEVGPGKVLTNLIARIAPEVTARAVGSPAELTQVLEEIGG